MNEFNNIKKGKNESTFDFNVRFQKGMYKFFQVMKMEENVCITTYFNAIDSKMAYILRDKDPKTLRDTFKIAVNIENNRRASSKLGKRDDPKLFNPRNNKRGGDKPATNKKNEEDKID